MMTIIRRDLLLAWRGRVQMALGPVFFLLFLGLCAIAFGGELSRIRPFAAPLIWLALIFSLLLGFPSIFERDAADGSLENLYLSRLGLIQITLGKAVSFFITGYLPICLASPMAALFFGLDKGSIAAITLSLLVAAPALILYGVTVSALLARQSAAGFLSVIMTVPFIIPVLIFGLAAVDSYPVDGLSSAPFLALAGLGFIALAVGVPATSAALATNLE